MHTLQERANGPLPIVRRNLSFAIRAVGVRFVVFFFVFFFGGQHIRLLNKGLKAMNIENGILKFVNLHIIR